MCDPLGFGIGENHIAVLQQPDVLWVIGENRHGQLGLKDVGWEAGSGRPPPDWYHEWTMVSSTNTVKTKRVLCGPERTFAYADNI